MNKKTLVLMVVAVMSLAGCQKEATSVKVYGRYVPERKDDFAWENEYAAFRFYGPALAPENPSNGVDLWLKNSPAPVVDTMYGRELRDKRPYHINYDGNLDCYKVGHTAGCGGPVIIAEDSLWIGGPYDGWEIVEQTPERLVFRLEYDSIRVSSQWVRAEVTVTAEAGTMWNTAEVIVTSLAPQGVEPIAIEVGGGVYTHDTLDNVWLSEDGGTMAYAEDALSDKQAAQMNYEYNGSTTQGRSYIALSLPGAEHYGIIDNTLYLSRAYTYGEKLTYRFGACWSEWSNGKRHFGTDDSWFEFVASSVGLLH
ncbi:MAG: DUF4861 family protein [Paludibacteraceae bacterium]|nr:DUF4861 family protein [Paludibacteraceae bacterium]MBR1480476.1 DUF4861 family protein [Paludibacteraceae bacterium]